MAKDPYKLLGVGKDADEKAIQSAYRKLAKKYHPDVNSGEAAAEKFKEITAAYNLLSNPKLKQQYDSGRVDANGQQNPYGGFGGGGNPFGGGGNPFGRSQSGGFGGGGVGGGSDMNDMLESLFGMQMGGGSPFGGGRSAAQQRRPKSGANIRYRVKISFFEAWTGLTKTIKPKSGGTLKITIPAGIETGETITLKGRGKPGQYGGSAGNALIDITVAPHKYFRRQGHNIYLDLPVMLDEALSAEKIPLKLPQGDINITLPSGDRIGQKLRLRGKGVKDGDLIIQPVIQLDSMTVNALKAVNLPTKEHISRDIRAGLFH
jgi:DnaJ-class molecular chaperone